MLEGFDLNENGTQRTKPPQIEVHTAITKRTSDRPRAAASRFEADSEEVLSHRPKLGGCEFASPVGAVGRIEGCRRVEEGHLPYETAAQRFPSAVSELPDQAADRVATAAVGLGRPHFGLQRELPPARESGQHKQETSPLFRGRQGRN